MLQSLKVIATALEPLGPTACFYLAAAVSDFYLPWADMVSVHASSAVARHSRCQLEYAGSTCVGALRDAAKT